MRSYSESARALVVVPSFAGRAARCEPQSNMELLLTAYKLRGNSLRSLADWRVRQENSETLGGASSAGASPYR